jgi:hypothetical protein
MLSNKRVRESMINAGAASVPSVNCELDMIPIILATAMNPNGTIRIIDPKFNRSNP